MSNHNLTYKNILVTLLRDKAGRHASGFPTENDFILEMSSAALNVLSDQDLIDSTEQRLRRAADHALLSTKVREEYARKGKFTWDDFAAAIDNETLGMFGLRRFDRETSIVRHVAVAVERDEDLLPDFSDGQVYLYKNKRRRNLVGTVAVDLRVGTLSGTYTEALDPDASYKLAFKNHDELVPLECVKDDAGALSLRITHTGEFAYKSEEAE